MKVFKDSMDWLEYARCTPTPKFITGLRGIGKTRLLQKARESLLAEGVPESRMLLLDTEDASLRRYSTHTQILDHIIGTLPRDGKSYIFVKEAAGLPTPEIVMGTLAATSRFEVYATSSSRRLLEHGLKDYFAGQILHLHLLPDERQEPYTLSEAAARWNAIFLYDVLSPNHIHDLPFINRLIGWLSDNLGTPLSLRQLASAISPTARLLSPHTIDTYLVALEDSHLVEKVIRWDTAEDAPQKTNYRYYFTDPWLRLAHFGPAPEHESRRMALNCAWAHLRHLTGAVYTASGTPDVDFITCDKQGRTLWRVNPSGELVKASP